MNQDQFVKLFIKFKFFFCAFNSKKPDLKWCDNRSFDFLLEYNWNNFSHKLFKIYGLSLNHCSWLFLANFYFQIKTPFFTLLCHLSLFIHLLLLLSSWVFYFCYWLIFGAIRESNLHCIWWFHYWPFQQANELR